MSDYSSDSELNRAIALSLQDTEQPQVIDLLSDDEDDDLVVEENDHVEQSRPLNGGFSRDMPDFHRPGHSAAGGLGGRGTTAASSSSQTVNASSTLQASNGLSDLAGMDRKKMEEERLERVRKRKAVSISPPPLARQATRYPLPSARANGEIDSDRHRVKKAKVYKQSPLETSGSNEEKASRSRQGPTEEAQAFLVPRRLAESKPLASIEFGLESHVNGQEGTSSNDMDNIGLPNVLSYRQQMNMLAPGIHFPNGTVKKTWAYGYPRQDDIKIEEVLQKDDLELAVLSAYQWDEEWILSKLNMRKTKVICVVQAKTEQEVGS
jgi:hypothetical protein